MRNYKPKTGLSRARQNELESILRQYKEMKKLVLSFYEISGNGFSGAKVKNAIGDPTANSAERALRYSKKIDAIEEAAKFSFPSQTDLFLKGLVSGNSYDIIVSLFGVVCYSRAEFYSRRILFFERLDSLL